METPRQLIRLIIQFFYGVLHLISCLLGDISPAIHYTGHRCYGNPRLLCYLFNRYHAASSLSQSLFPYQHFITNPPTAQFFFLHDHILQNMCIFIDLPNLRQEVFHPFLRRRFKFLVLHTQAFCLISSIGMIGQQIDALDFS